MEFGIETGRFGRGCSFIRHARAGAFLPLLVVAACSGKAGPEVSTMASIAELIAVQILGNLHENRNAIERAGRNNMIKLKNE